MSNTQCNKQQKNKSPKGLGQLQEETPRIKIKLLRDRVPATNIMKIFALKESGYSSKKMNEFQLKIMNLKQKSQSTLEIKV